MFGLKAYIHESIQQLDTSQLKLLSEVLRIDLRGCEDREDVHRIITGLLCLDKDTSLGLFLSWMRNYENEKKEQQATTSSKTNEKQNFINTFVPLISPRKTDVVLSSHTESPSPRKNQKQKNIENQLKEHHLQEEIEQRLEELHHFENDFKESERTLHIGTPSFEKVKKFLLKLTILRAKEDEIRHFFMKRNHFLSEEYLKIKQEALQTREQLDFFVVGFTNLRQRHDLLLEKATEMKAENETAQEIFLSMASTESLFAYRALRTLEDQLQKSYIKDQKLQEANLKIQELQKETKHLQNEISFLKNARGNALKNANCLKLQLKKTKQLMYKMANESLECRYFRNQTIKLRSAMGFLLGYCKDSILKDIKSTKQNLSKGAWKILKELTWTANLVPPEVEIGAVTLPPHEQQRLVQATDTLLIGIPHIVKSTQTPNTDIDKVIQGIVLVGGKEKEASVYAQILETSFHYVTLDVQNFLSKLREEAEAARAALFGNKADTPEIGDEENSTITNTTPMIAPALNNKLEFATYLHRVAEYLRIQMHSRGACGYLLYNWEFSRQDLNLLINMGFKVDSILDLSGAPLPPAPSSPPANAVRPTVVLSVTEISVADATSTTAASLAQAAQASMAAKSKTPPTPTSKTSISSGLKTPPKSSLSTVGSPKTKSTISFSGASTRSSTAKASSVPQVTLSPSINWKNVFKGMGINVFRQIEHFGSYPEERFEKVIQVLENQKSSKLTPHVVWDENTSIQNEKLAMYVEEIEVLLYQEQENRKPKKQSTSSSSTIARTGENSNTNTNTNIGVSISNPSNYRSSNNNSKTKASRASAIFPTKGTNSTSSSRGGTSASTSSTSSSRSTSISPGKRLSSITGTPSKTSPSKPGSSTSKPSSPSKQPSPSSKTKS